MKVRLLRRYAGQTQLSAGGLVFNGYRTLIPQLGVYTSPDPLHRQTITTSLGAGAYTYAANRPFVNQDPTGRTLVPCGPADWLTGACSTGVQVAGVIPMPAGVAITVPALPALSPGAAAWGAVILGPLAMALPVTPLGPSPDCKDDLKKLLKKDCQEAFEEDEKDCIDAARKRGELFPAITHSFRFDLCMAGAMLRRHLCNKGLR